MSLHRQIWIKHFGKIPKDEFGVTHEIHHKDGNKLNNDIDNLICISLQEHFDIHYRQKDWFACKLIMLKLSIPEEIRYEVLSMAAKKSSIKMTGKKYNSEKYIERNSKISKTLTGRKRPDNSKRMMGVPRPDLSKILTGRKRSLVSILKLKESLSKQPNKACPHCGVIGKGSNMTRYHFDNCKYNPVEP